MRYGQLCKQATVEMKKLTKKKENKRIKKKQTKTNKKLTKISRLYR
jgi:hypothetical protein